MASVVGVYGRKYRQTSENRARSNSRLPCLFENVGPFKTIFGDNRFISIEAYDRTRHYDLLVTNNPIHKKEQTPVYYLKNDLDLEDLAGIRQLLFT